MFAHYLFTQSFNLKAIALTSCLRESFFCQECVAFPNDGIFLGDDVQKYFVFTVCPLDPEKTQVHCTCCILAYIVILQ